MDFKVKLEGIHYYLNGGSTTKSLIESKEIGTAIVNELSISASNLNNIHIKGVTRTEVTISEELAQTIPLFKEYNHIGVSITTDISKDLFFIEFNKEEKILEYKLDIPKFLDIWKKNEYSQFIMSDKTREILKEALKQKELAEQKRLAHLEELKQKEEENKKRKLKEDNERIEWIEKFGSKYLKDCQANNIKAYSEYMIERCNIEFPNFEVDIKNMANWREIYSPSKKSLNMLLEMKSKYKDLDIELVYLTNDTEGYSCKCDAIIIHKYLKYDLVYIID